MTVVVWWEIEATEPDAFQRFHGALWAWTFRRAFQGSEFGEEYWIISSGGDAVGGLQRAEPGRTPVPGVRLYVEVEALEESLDRVTVLGGRVERRRTALGGEDRWFATFVDPAGVSFGLWTPNAEEQLAPSTVDKGGQQATRIDAKCEL